MSGLLATLPRWFERSRAGRDDPATCDTVGWSVDPGDPSDSRLLMHPLEPDAGGDEFHNGGRQFASQDDPWFQALEAWVLGQAGQ